MIKYDPKRTIFGGRVLEGDTRVRGVQSGGAIDMYFVLLDKYNQPIATDSSSKLFITYI